MHAVFMLFREPCKKAAEAAQPGKCSPSMAAFRSSRYAIASLRGDNGEKMPL